MATIELSNIAHTYEPTVEDPIYALKELNMTWQDGGTYALLGPSGCGKTTMLNIIGGLDLADSGQVVVDGNSFEQMNQSQLAEMRLNKVGFVFQAYNLVPVLSALENVEFVMLLQGVPTDERRQRARGILDEVGLEGKYDRRPGELSGEGVCQGVPGRVKPPYSVPGPPKYRLAPTISWLFWVTSHTPLGCSTPEVSYRFKMAVQ